MIERPASVAKELVENALDAGAGRIEIELGDGGRSLVTVADDGEGMDREDARLAFERHATSKLTSAGDLDSVGTYGFRGEALPSIAAVARVRVLTCPQGGEEGTELLLEGGRLTRMVPGPARPGTIIWVRDLFYNTPARREAMRSAPAEAARVGEVAGQLALARPDVAVVLSSDGRLLWATPGSGNLVDAAAALLGARAVREMVPVSGAPGPVRVSGLAGLPQAARRDGRRQYLFCNGRPVHAGLLRRAVEEAYRGLLESGRTPVYILRVDLPASAVDVNIHPAKTFVRFRDHGEPHRAVLSALRQALGRGDLFPGRLGRKAAPAPERPFPPSVFPDPAPEPPAPAAEPPAEPRRDFWGQVREGRGGLDLLSLEPLGQVGQSFVAAAGPDGLYVLDQHAAHERVVFDRLSREGPSPSQVLAIPETLDLAPGEEDLLVQGLDLLRSVGVDVEPFGGRTIVIRAVPSVLGGVPPARLVGDFLDRLREDPSRSLGGGAGPRSPGGATGPGWDRVAAVRALAACKASLKAGTAISNDEARALLAELAATSEPRVCPHGRPTVLRFSLAELRRAFGRL